MKSDSTIYKGIRINGRPMVTVNDEELTPEFSQRHYNHSPDGFEWGSGGGGGPAQLALAILLDFTSDPHLVHFLYQSFKRDRVAGFVHAGWVITGAKIREWLEAQWAHD